MDFDRAFSGLFNAIEVIGLAVIAYSGWRVKQLATKTIEITSDTNVRAVNTEKGMEEIRHETNSKMTELLEATARRFQLEGEAAGRIEERSSSGEREAERHERQTERQAERAEDRDERQRMRNSWQAHDRDRDQDRRREEDRERRGLPDP
jgi:hypothetical protein